MVPSLTLKRRLLSYLQLRCLINNDGKAAICTLLQGQPVLQDSGRTRAATLLTSHRAVQRHIRRVVRKQWTARAEGKSKGHWRSGHAGHVLLHKRSVALKPGKGAVRQHFRLQVDIVAVHRVAIIVVVLGAVITHGKTHAVAAAVNEVGKGGRGRQQALSGPGPRVKRGVEEPLASRVPGKMDSEKMRLLDLAAKNWISKLTSFWPVSLISGRIGKNRFFKPDQWFFLWVFLVFCHFF